MTGKQNENAENKQPQYEPDAMDDFLNRYKKELASSKKRLDGIVKGGCYKKEEEKTHD